LPISREIKFLDPEQTPNEQRDHQTVPKRQRALTHAATSQSLYSGCGQEVLPRLYVPARKSRLWSDNIHDLFIPTGFGDILDIALLTLLSGHFLASGSPVVSAWSPTPQLNSWDLAPTMDSALAPVRIW
jgi:hypothetical protein